MHASKIEAAFGNIMMVTSWHKSLGEIINTAIKAGFLIDKLVEPQPHEEMKDISPQTHEKLSKIPEFMILRLKKS
jgi:microcompartment protein CcmL/EutN